jgi:hypothetical protein
MAVTWFRLRPSRFAIPIAFIPPRYSCSMASTFRSSMKQVVDGGQKAGLRLDCGDGESPTAAQMF